MARDANYLICIFMNINENLKNKGKIITNTISNWYKPKTVINLLLLHVFTLSVIQFDRYFYIMVLYENDLICIFMNINENLKIMQYHWLNW